MSQLESLIRHSSPHMWTFCQDSLKAGKPIQVGWDDPVDILDRDTMNYIEINRLLESIDRTTTYAGIQTLAWSLCQPPTDIELIHAKQKAIEELEAKKELSHKLTEMLSTVSEKESDMYRFVFGDFDESNQHKLYLATSVFFQRLVDGIKDIPKVESQYLNILLEDIRALDTSKTMNLLRGPVYRTFRGLKTSDEIRWYTPRIKYTPRSFKPAIATSTFVGSILTPLATRFVHLLGTDPKAWFETPVKVVEKYSYEHQMETLERSLGEVVSKWADITLDLDWFVWVMTILLGVYVTYATSFYLPRGIDHATFTKPLRDIFFSDKNVRASFTALGKIDEIMSLYNYKQEMGSQVSMPKIVDSDSHYLIARQAMNPIILSDKYCVPNDIDLKNIKLLVITGPNSGGKSTYAKSCCHMQIMGQIGGAVPAQNVELVPVDHIFYRMQRQDSVDEPEGRFGTELAEVRDCFLHYTPKSLCVLDAVLAGATSYEEATEHIQNTLKGFYAKGGNLIFITADDNAAKMFKEKNIGEYLQAEFREGAPTRKLVSGIAEKCFSDAVAKKIGFTKDDINRHLQEKGYKK